MVFVRAPSFPYLSLTFLYSSVLLTPNGSFCFPSFLFDPGEPLTKNLPGPYVDSPTYLYPPESKFFQGGEERTARQPSPAAFLGKNQLRFSQPVSSRKMGAARGLGVGPCSFFLPSFLSCPLPPVSACGHIARHLKCF